MFILSIMVVVIIIKFLIDDWDLKFFTFLYLYIFLNNYQAFILNKPKIQF